MNMTKRVAILLLCTVLSGCSKEEPAAAPKAAEPAPAATSTAPTPANPPVPPAAPQEVPKAETAAAAVPTADKSVPLSAYQELDSGRELMFAFHSLDTMPVDYEKIGYTIKPELSYTLDAFSKRDMLEALKPGIDMEIAKVKGTRYYFMVVGDSLEPYDFDIKGFRLPAFQSATSYRYFRDLPGYRLTFPNAVAFSRLPVPIEAEAKQIESLRTSSHADTMSMKIYFFLTDTVLGDTVVNAELTKVQLLDSKGRVLAEM